MDEVEKEILVEKLKNEFDRIKTDLTEKEKRVWAASESLKIGHGGDGIVQKATGISRPTIRKGRNEIQSNAVCRSGRIRKHGGGRKSFIEKHPQILKKFDGLIHPFSRDESKHPTLRWTRKSTAVLTEELNELMNPEEKGKSNSESGGERITISQKTLYSIMKNLGYDMSLNQRKAPPQSFPFMDTQFHVIYEEIKLHNQNGLPVVSLELYRGRHCDGNLLDEKIEIKNENWEKISVEEHTALSVVESIQQWLDDTDHPSRLNFPGILVTIDGEKNRTLKQSFQELSNKNEIIIRLCHFPPCTRKWNKVEQKTIFPFIVSRPDMKSEKFCSVINLIENPVKMNPSPTSYILSHDRARNLKKDKQFGIWNDLLIPTTI